MNKTDNKNEFLLILLSFFEKRVFIPVYCSRRVCSIPTSQSHSNNYLLETHMILKGSIQVKRIESSKYYNAVKAYFVENKDPAKVYAFLLNRLWKDKYELSQKMYYQRVDMLEMTDNCIRFYTGTECDLVLCSNPDNKAHTTDFLSG